MVAAGLALDAPGSRDWLACAGPLRRELAFQLGSDGAHCERSPMYQAVLLEHLFEACVFHRPLVLLRPAMAFLSGIPVAVGHALLHLPRDQRVITPVDSTHKVVLMAIERGKLQELIFDNRALLSHRVMAAILGVILALPPVKRAMASRQVRSRYLEGLIRRFA